MTDIQALREAFDHARAELTRARDAYYDAVRAEHPIKVGMVIRSTEDVLAKVIRTDVMEWFGGSRVEVVAVLQKQSGEWGTRKAAMWRPQWGNPIIVEPQP